MVAAPAAGPPSEIRALEREVRQRGKTAELRLLSYAVVKALVVFVLQ